MDPEIKEFDMDAGVAQIAEGMGFDEPEADVTEVEVAETPEAEAPPVVDTPAEVVAPVRNVPKSWAKEYHEHWAKVDPKVQEYIEKREQQMHEGLEQYRQHSTIGKSLSEAIQPFKQVLQQQGVDEVKAVSYLLSAHQRLTTGTPESRAAAYADLGRNLGLSQSQADPTAQAALQTAQRVERMIQERETAKIAEAREATAKEVEAFASDPAHPYFDEVAEDIIVMIQGGHKLQDAYDKAIWANPVTRAKEQSRLSQENEKQLREKAKQEAEKAKKASSTNVRNRDTRSAPTEPMGKMEDTLKETLRDIESRTH